jgi:hypothetical protein
MVNGKRLDKKSVALRDGDVVGFARYEFTFLSPNSFYRMISDAGS